MQMMLVWIHYMQKTQDYWVDGLYHSFYGFCFFLGRKIEAEKLDFSRIQKNIAVLISIFIIAGSIFLIAGFFKESYYYKIENLLTGTHYHLWFIGSLLFAYLFIWYIYFIISLCTYCRFI